jgi:hypothetical protein
VVRGNIAFGVGGKDMIAEAGAPRLDPDVRAASLPQQMNAASRLTSGITGPRGGLSWPVEDEEPSRLFGDGDA